MSLTELKSKITEKINHIDDEERLKEIDEMIDDEILGLDENGVYHLSEEQIEVVEESLEQYKKGETISNEDADKEIQEWLKK